MIYHNNNDPIISQYIPSYYPSIILSHQEDIIYPVDHWYNIPSILYLNIPSYYPTMLFKMPLLILYGTEPSNDSITTYCRLVYTIIL